ncbi:MAG: hypothetical protein V1738_01840, partial [Patescibacteria group bacterium]
MSVLLVGFGLTQAFASGPSENRLLNYQIRLTDSSGTLVADGVYDLKLTFYDTGTGATRLYTACSADGSATGTPTAVEVQFTSGVGSVLLGDMNNACATGTAVAIPGTLFNNALMYLGVTVETDSEMTPRKRIVGAGYAMNADRVDDLETSAAGGTSAFVPVTDTNGNLTLTGNPQGTGATQGSLTINPATADANEKLFGVALGGTEKFSIDEDGDAVVSHNLTVDTNTLFVDADNNRVGVGTTSPNSALDVNGELRSTRIAVSGQYISLSGDSAGGVIKSVSAEGAPKIFRIQSLLSDQAVSVNNKIYFDTGTTGTPTTRMAIDSSGNVGVGTTVPSALFSVGSASGFQVNNSGNVIASGSLDSATSEFSLAASASTVHIAGGASSTGCTVDSTGAMNCVSLKEAGVALSSKYLAFGGYIANENPFAAVGDFYIPEIYNEFFNGDKRYTVTQTGFNTWTAGYLFNNGYDDYVQILANGTGVISIDVDSKSETTSNGYTYPEGYIYVNFYYTHAPESVSGRVQNRDGVWVNMTATNISASSSQNVWRLTIPSMNYGVLYEITVDAFSGSDVWVSEIEYAMTRPAGAPLAVVDKFRDNSLYKSLYFKDSNNTAVVSIVPTATTTITTTGDVAVDGGDLTTTATTASLFNTGATTLNVGGEATTLNLAGGSSSTGCTIDSTGAITCSGTTGGSFANRALSNLSSVAINESLIPDSNDDTDLGSASLRWRDIYLGAGSVHIGTSAEAEGVISYTDASQDVLNFSTDATGAGDIAFFTDDLYLDKSLGYVGIGDTSPLATLTVGSGDLFQVAGATGNVTTAGDVAVNGGDITTSAETFNIAASATTVNIAGGSSSTGCSVNSSGAITCSGLMYTNAGGIAGTGTANLSSTAYVQSRGMNLLTNGSGLLGNNYNFSSFTFDQSDTHGGKGSFKNSTYSTAVTVDEYLPIDGTRTYKLSLWAKSTVHATGAHAYFGVTPYDIDNQLVNPIHYMRFSGTDTTLAQDIKPGDTTVVLTDGSNWQSNFAAAYGRQIQIWNYTNSYGYTYPPYTYTRNNSYYLSSYSTSGTWAIGGITGNTITLTSPWPDTWGTIPAGTAVSNGSSGGTYKYIAASNVDVPAAWTNYTGLIGGWDTSGSGATNLFPYGTASIRVSFLMNRDVAGNTTNVSDVWFSELTSANIEAASATQAGIVTLGNQQLGTGDKYFAGNVGVGTTSPSTRLHLSGTTSTIRLDSTAATSVATDVIVANNINDSYRSPAAKLQVQRDGSLGQGWNFLVAETSAGTISEAMRITNAGYVGIGDSTPSALLTVGSGDMFQVDASGNVTTAGFIDTSGSTFDVGSSATTLNLGSGATTVNLAGGSSSTGCTIDGSGNLACSGSVSGSGGLSGTGTQYQTTVWSGSSTVAGIGPGTGGQLLISQGASANPAYTSMSGDATIASNGAVTVADDSHAHTTTTISGLDASNDFTTGTLPVARGGTGASSLSDLITLTTHTTGN